jgi:hypothetical protein
VKTSNLSCYTGLLCVEISYVIGWLRETKLHSFRQISHQYYSSFFLKPNV